MKHRCFVNEGSLMKKVLCRPGPHIEGYHSIIGGIPSTPKSLPISLLVPKVDFRYKVEFGVYPWMKIISED